MVVREHGAESCAHIPVRTCVGCRVRAPKEDLLRVVAGASDDGMAVVPDPGSTAPGRGAYIHPTLACLELAVRRRAFTRALRVLGPLGEARVREHLQQTT